MTLVGDYVPILPGSDNQDYQYNAQLQALYAMARNLSLTIRDGAIQNNDKAGNLSAVYVVYTSNAVANTEDAVPHALGRVPVGYIITRQNKASAPLYDSGTTFTSSIIYLKSPTASVTWTLLVF